MLEIFTHQFILRAFFTGGFVAILLGWLGAFVVTRKMSFMGDGIAHASLFGIALALLFGFSPLPIALLVGILTSLGIYFLEQKTDISSDMAIGIMFTTGMALGITMLNFYDSYQPELISYLFGNILIINNFDLLITVITGFIIFAILFFTYRKLVFATFDRDGAYMSGINPQVYDILLYVITATAIILSIKLVGIILVSALLIMPSAISRLFANSFKSFIVLAVIFSVLIVFLGIVFSYYLDLPSGSTIILTGAILFILGYFLKGRK